MNVFVGPCVGLGKSLGKSQKTWIIGQPVKVMTAPPSGKFFLLSISKETSLR